MKIKQNYTRYSSFKVDRQLLKKRKFLVRAILGTGGLVLVAILLISILLYGAYLYRIGKSSYENPMLVKISELDFSFLRDNTQRGPVDFDEAKLNIELKHLTQMHDLGQQAYEKGMINEAFRRKSFPAELIYNGESHKVRIGLANTIAMHLQDPVKWSFQVSTTGDDVIMDMHSFDLLPPPSGSYMIDWLNTELIEERGVRSMKGDFVTLAVNGKTQGLYYLQERLSEKVQQNHRFEKGILFDVEEGLRILGEDKLIKHAATEDQVALLKGRWSDFKTGKLPLADIFDLEKMGELFAILDLANHKYSKTREKLRFYFNPISERVEPVVLKISDLGASDPFDFSSFLEKNDLNDQLPAGHFKDSLIHAFVENLEFKRSYLREAAVLCQNEFLDQFLIQRGKKLDVLLKSPSQSPVQHSPIQALFGNAKLLRYTIFPNEAEIIAWFDKKEEKYLSVQLRNQQELPLEVLYLSWRDSILFLPEKPIILETNTTQPQTFQFSMPKTFPWADSLLPELTLNYNMLGVGAPKRSVLVYPWSYEDRQDYARNPAARRANYKSFDFIEEKADGNTLVIPPGNWTLLEDLIIPPKKRLEIEAGARIDIVDHAKILSYSPIFSLGLEGNPVTITSSDATGEGLTVIRAKQRSYLIHTNFDRLSSPLDEGWQLTGAVSFYESPVIITACKLANNQRGG